MGALQEKPVDEALEGGLVSVDVDPRVRLYTAHVLYPMVKGTKDYEGCGTHKVAVAQALVGSDVPEMPVSIGHYRSTNCGLIVWGCCEPLHDMGLPRVVVADKDDFLCALHFS